MKLDHTSHLLSVAQTKGSHRWMYKIPRFPNESKSIVHIHHSKFSYRIRFAEKKGIRRGVMYSFRRDNLRCIFGRPVHIHCRK